MTTQIARAGAFPGRVEILAEGVIQTMIVTKSKLLTAVLLTCGVAGSGVGIFAQIPGSAAPASEPAPAAPQVVMPYVPALGTDSPQATYAAGVPKLELLPGTIENPNDDIDRLGNLEKKLDRVLEALEGNSGFRPAPAKPITRANPNMRGVESGGKGTGHVVIDLQPGQPPSQPFHYEAVPATGKVANPTDERLTILEQKLGRLEARISRLELYNTQQREQKIMQQSDPAVSPFQIPAPAQPPAPPAPPVAVPL